MSASVPDRELPLADMGPLKASAPENPWIEWNGGDVPVQGTEAKGWVQFAHETREQAEKRPVTVIDYWPWFGEDEQPIVVAYRVVQP